MTRRVRWRRGLGSATLAVLLLGATACSADPYYRPPLDDGAALVPATARSTAAAMLDHLEDADVRAVGGIEEPLEGGGTVLLATVAVEDAEVSVSVSPEDAGVEGTTLCGELADLCSQAVATDDAGRRTDYQVLWQAGVRGGDPGAGGMVLRRGDARVSVTVSGPLVPRAVDWTMFPVSRRVLESILLDPAIGLRTLPELVEAGAGLEDFRDRAFNL